MNKIIMIICGLSIVISSGCNTIKSKDIVIPEQLKIEQTPNYKVDTKELDNKLLKAADIKTQYGKLVNGKIEITQNSEEADMILLDPTEFSKFADVIEIAFSYKTIVKSQSELVNSYIEEINNVKSLAAIERAKLIIASENWKSVVDLYDQEHKIRVRENIFSKIELVVVSGISMFALAGGL